MGYKSKKIFIVGTGRCGTVTMSKVFDTMPKMKAIHEGVYYKGGEKKVLGNLRDINNFIYYQSSGGHDSHYKASVNLSGNEETLGRMSKRFTPRELFIENLELKKINFCEADPYGHCYINFIANKYPEAKFVHLVRNGYNTCQSWFKRKKNAYPDELDIKKWHPFALGKPRPLKGVDPYFDAWPKMCRLERVCWFWNYVNSDIEKRLSKISQNRHIVFKLEGLNQRSMANLLNFLDLPNSYNKDALKVHNASPKSKSIWDLHKKRIFEKYCKKTMVKYDYKML